VGVMLAAKILVNMTLAARCGLSISLPKNKVWW
jgi:hypothetical protein